ncbi:MAG: glycosyltransferase [Candidatus Cybelea sp.]
MAVPPPRVLFIASFPPRERGIASFTQDLVMNYAALSGSRVDVIAAANAGLRETLAYRVVGHIDGAHPQSYYDAAARANRDPYDVVNIQHEYRSFGGDAGEWCIGFMRALRKPVVLSLHTIVSHPGAKHATLVRALCNAAAKVVVLGRGARRLLIAEYGVDPLKIKAILCDLPDAPGGLRVARTHAVLFKAVRSWNVVRTLPLMTPVSLPNLAV